MDQFAVIVNDWLLKTAGFRDGISQLFVQLLIIFYELDQSLDNGMPGLPFLVG